MRLSTTYLLPGMKLSHPVYITNGELLLSKGYLLTARSILALRHFGVLSVDVELFSNMDCQQADVLGEELCCNAMTSLQEWASNDKKANLKKVTSTVEQIINELVLGKSYGGNLTQICSHDMYTFAHSVDVCVLSLMMGLKLGYDKVKLMKLGVGCLLHDLGKTSVPSWILNKPGKLTEEEYKQIQKHPYDGYKRYTESMADVDSKSASIILNHHEKYDGSGYPHGISGDKIGEMETICAIADVYNAITTDRVYRKALPPHEAYEMIMASGNFMFNERIVIAFLECIVPYPVGTAVKLSNGLIALVSRLNSGFNYRPVVKLLHNQEEVDLQTEYNVVIKEPINTKEAMKLALQNESS